MFHVISFVVIIFSFIFNSLIVMTSAYCYRSLSYPCHDGISIDYPFWYQDRNISASDYRYQDRNISEISYCGYPELEIKCGGKDGRALMNISDHLFYVLNIDNERQELRVVDVDVDEQDCPHPKRNVSISTVASSFVLFNSDMWYIFYNCSRDSIYPGDTDSNGNKYQRIPCLDNYYNSTVGLRSSYYLQAVYGSYPSPYWYKNCEETVVALMISELGGYDLSFNYTKSAKFGFELLWNVPIECVKCESSGGRCYYDNTTQVYRCNCFVLDERSVDGFFCPQNEGLSTGLKAIIGVSTGVVGLLLILLLIYRKTFYTLGYLAIFRWKKKIKKPTNVEEFLESYGVALHSYSYSEIKRMTNSFKDKLGQGGYGSVFQGKLNRDGLLVAVKVLNESKGNGEDFINEVATIGRTNHVNVVSLLGFCTEGTKRALVYEFMPNGSLERFIYNDKATSSSTTTLGWDKLYHIALGIARGLEYLHCRCNTRIVHFDIKPHNILLDQDFCPKISDFGLAKLCPTKESIVSMVGARGTMGYIAPEISCRNLGGVSHKSDVYSYGMMVLEMIGGRKNLDVTVENMSGIYFPHWIYNQLKQDSKVEGPEVIKFEGAGEILKDTTAKKMIIVALWCIQTHPASRPSMTKVVEMLEGSAEDLQMPPNPSMDPPSIASSSSS